MGNLVETPLPSLEAIEQPLPWGPVVRGFHCNGGVDSAFLLHEPGTDVDAWGFLPVQLARELQMATVTLDLPGHGLSDDPWDPHRLPDLLRALPQVSPGSTRRFVIAAGRTATAALAIASDLGLSGLVSLSPEVTPPGWKPARSPAVPKLFVAGSKAGNDLETARKLASSCGGWTVVTSLPLTTRGTAFLESAWSKRVAEEVAAFLRDCMRPQGRTGRFTPNDAGRSAGRR